jgi:hypothetical protein
MPTQIGSFEEIMERARKMREEQADEAADDEEEEQTPVEAPGYVADLRQRIVAGYHQDRAATKVANVLERLELELEKKSGRHQETPPERAVRVLGAGEHILRDVDRAVSDDELQDILNRAKEAYAKGALSVHPDKSLRDLAESETFKEAIRTLEAEDILKLGSDSAFISAKVALGGIIGAVAGLALGPGSALTAAFGIGLAAGKSERDHAAMELLSESGFDIFNVNSLREAFKDPEGMLAMYEAKQRGDIVTVGETVTAGVGRFVPGARLTKNLSTQALQPIGGGLTEALKTKLLEGRVNPGSTMAEMGGELSTGPFEVAGVLYGMEVDRRRAAAAAAEIAEPSDPIIESVQQVESFDQPVQTASFNEANIRGIGPDEPQQTSLLLRQAMENSGFFDQTSDRRLPLRTDTPAISSTLDNLAQETTNRRREAEAASADNSNVVPLHKPQKIEITKQERLLLKEWMIKGRDGRELSPDTEATYDQLLFDDDGTLLVTRAEAASVWEGIHEAIDILTEHRDELKASEESPGIVGTATRRINQLSGVAVKLRDTFGEAAVSRGVFESAAGAREGDVQPLGAIQRPTADNDALIEQARTENDRRQTLESEEAETIRNGLIAAEADNQSIPADVVYTLPLNEEQNAFIVADSTGTTIHEALINDAGDGRQVQFFPVTPDLPYYDTVKSAVDARISEESSAPTGPVPVQTEGAPTQRGLRFPNERRTFPGDPFGPQVFAPEPEQLSLNLESTQSVADRQARASVKMPANQLTVALSQEGQPRVTDITHGGPPINRNQGRRDGGDSGDGIFLRVSGGFGEFSPKKQDINWTRMFKNMGLQLLTTAGKAGPHARRLVDSNVGIIKGHILRSTNLGEKLKLEAERMGAKNDTALSIRIAKAGTDILEGVSRATAQKHHNVQLSDTYVETLGQMRATIDRLSGILLANGAIAQELRAIIAENQGFYLHKSFDIANKLGRTLREFISRNVDRVGRLTEEEQRGLYDAFVEAYVKPIANNEIHRLHPSQMYRMAQKHGLIVTRANQPETANEGVRMPDGTVEAATRDNLLRALQGHTPSEGVLNTFLEAELARVMDVEGRPRSLLGRDTSAEKKRTIALSKLQEMDRVIASALKENQAVLSENSRTLTLEEMYRLAQTLGDDRAMFTAKELIFNRQIRRALGEIIDPSDNYSRTILALAKSVTAYNMLDQLVAEGMAGRIELGIGQPKGRATVPLANAKTDPTVSGMKVLVGDVTIPANQLYLTPEVREGLDELVHLDELTDNSTFLRTIYAISGGAKLDKVLLSFRAHPRNFMGSLTIAAKFGLIGLTHPLEAWRSIKQTKRAASTDLARTGAVGKALGQPVRALVGKQLSAAELNERDPWTQELIARFAELGVYHDSIHIGSLIDIANRMNLLGKDSAHQFLSNSTWLDADGLAQLAMPDNTSSNKGLGKVVANRAKRAGRGVLATAGTLFRLEDELIKFNGMFTRMRQYSRVIAGKEGAAAYDKWSKQQQLTAEEQAIIDHAMLISAEEIKNITPTFSRAPEWIKALSRSPLVGPFPTFHAEVVRNTARQIMYVYAALKNAEMPDGTVLTGDAAKRLRHHASAIALNMIIYGATVGFAVSASHLAKAIVTKAPRGEGGASDDEMKSIVDTQQLYDDIKGVLPEWERHNLLIIRRTGDRYVFRINNLSYLAPDSRILEMWDSMWYAYDLAKSRGKDTDVAAQRALYEAALKGIYPYIDVEVATSNIMEAVRGETFAGKRIWLNTDSKTESFGKGLEYVIANSIPPSTAIKQVSSVVEWLSDDTQSIQDRYNSVLGFATGLPMKEVDVRKQIPKTVKANVQRFQAEVAAKVSAELFSPNAQFDSKEDFIEAARAIDEERRDAFRDIQDVVKRAERLGVGPVHYINELPKSINRVTGYILMSDAYVPHIVEKQDLDEFAAKGGFTGPDDPELLKRFNWYHEFLAEVL